MKRSAVLTLAVLLAACSDDVDISKKDVSHWNEAYSWGNHEWADYMTRFDFEGTPAGTIDAEDIASWNTAVLWGDHAAAGYLRRSEFDAHAASRLQEMQLEVLEDLATSGFVPADEFARLPASRISEAHMTAWNQAYAWGNHAEAGYLTADSAAASISFTDVQSWREMVSWGNHATAGYIRQEADPSVGVLREGAVPYWNGEVLAESSISVPSGQGVLVESMPVGLGGVAAGVHIGDSTVAATDIWQTFKPELNGLLRRLELSLTSPTAGAGSPLTISVYEGEGVGGTLLARQEAVIAAEYDWQQFRFDQPARLTAGSTYTIRLQVPVASNPWLGINSGDAYEDGSLGGDLTEGDLVFRAWVTFAEPLTETFRVSHGVVKVRDVLNIHPRVTAPPDPAMGDLYFDRTSRKLRYFDGVEWNDL